MRASIVVVVLCLACACLADFSFSSFNDTSSLDFSLIGAAVYDSASASLQLVQSTRNRVGAAFHIGSSEQGEYCAPGFVTTFTFQFSATVGLGGAGVAFVLQPNSAFVQGTTGAGIGYGDASNGPAGIYNSLAIEFDCFQDASMNDTNANHAGVHSKGNNPNSSNENAVILSLVNTTIPVLQTAGIHTVYINYQAVSTSLVVALDGVTILTSNNFTLTDWIQLESGTGESFVGITSSTNSNDYFEVDILSWDFWQGNGTIIPASTEIYGSGYEGAVYQATNTYYIQLIDNYGYNVTQPGSAQGVDVTCALAYGTNQNNLTSISCTTTYLVEGLYDASYTMPEVGVFTLITTVGTYVNTTVLTVSGPPYAPLCTASGTGTVAVAGVLATFDIQTFDESGAPILGGAAATFDVTLTLTTDPSTVVTGLVSYNGDGTYTATYNVTIVGAYDLNVTLVAAAPNGGPIQGSPFNVFAVAGVYSASNSYAYGPGIVAGAAGQPTYFYVQAVDAFGNNATSPSSWTITSATASAPLVANSISTTLIGSNGLSNNTYVQNTAGSFSLSVTDNGTIAISGSPFNVTISAALAYPGTTLASGALYNATAGVNEVIIITPYDQFNNLVNDANLVFNVTITGSATISVLAVYNTDGTYTATYNETIVGAYTIDINLTAGGAQTGPIASSPFALTVVPGPIYVPNCFAVGAGLSTAQAGEVANFTIYSVDLFNNNITTLQSVVFTLTFDASFNGTTDPVVANADGTFSASYTSFNAGTFNLSVTSGSQSIEGSPFSVVVTAGPAYGPSSVPVGSGYTNAVAGVISNFTVETYDQYGNPLSYNSGPCSGNLTDSSNNTYPLTCVYNSGNTYDASYNVSAAGNYIITIYINGLLVQNSPANVTVVAGAVDPASTTASGPGLTTAVAGEAATFVITPRDQFGNAVDNSTLLFNVTLTKSGSPTVIGFVVYSGGLYYVNYTLTTPTGTWSLSVTLFSVEISGSPFTPVLTAGAISAVKSFAFPTTGANNNILANGTSYEQNVFYVQAVDTFSNNITTNDNATFIAVFVGSSNVTELTVNGVYDKDGQYSFTYTINSTDNFLVTVSEQIVQISNSPLSLYVSPGLPVAPETTATGFGVTYGIAGQFSNFTITTRDAGGVIYPQGGATFNITLFYTNTTENNSTGTVNVTDNGDGTYFCTYNVTVAGNWTLDIVLASVPGENPSAFIIAADLGEISGSPFFPLIFASENCPQNAQVIGLSETGEINVVQSFQIQSADCYGNAVSTSNVYYDVLVSGPDCTFANSTDQDNGLVDVDYMVSLPGNYTIEIMERGVPIIGSPFPVTITGDVDSELSSTSLLFMWLMIVFIILYVIFCLLLIGFVVFTQRKQLQRGFSSNYKRIQSDSSSSSSSSD